MNSPQLKFFEAEIGEGCARFTYHATPLLAEPIESAVIAKGARRGEHL